MKNVLRARKRWITTCDEVINVCLMFTSRWSILLFVDERSWGVVTQENRHWSVLTKCLLWLANLCKIFKCLSVRHEGQTNLSHLCLQRFLVNCPFFSSFQTEDQNSHKNGIHLNGTYLNGHLEKNGSRMANGVTSNGSLRSRKWRMNKRIWFMY